MNRTDLATNIKTVSDPVSSRICETLQKHSTENTRMQAYTTAMDFDLPSPRTEKLFSLYLEVDYQVEDSQIIVRSVRTDDGFGHDITSALSDDDLQAVAQQIEDKVEEVC
ncbi:MAG TPA: hypothetical protein VKB53_07805 [Gammaproteobacteria bacterium]|jgi:hypothetical protein|nr:hypothetical protein [Gammaproteobacteria bacterium]